MVVNGAQDVVIQVPLANIEVQLVGKVIGVSLIIIS